MELIELPRPFKKVFERSQKKFKSRLNAFHVRYDRELFSAEEEDTLAKLRRAFPSLSRDLKVVLVAYVSGPSVQILRHDKDDLCIWPFHDERCYKQPAFNRCVDEIMTCLRKYLQTGKPTWVYDG